VITLDDILDFFEVPTGDAFDVAPEKAIEFFGAKGLRQTFSYADMVKGAHAHSFTVAKMMDVDMLGQVRASLDSALANGTSFKEWEKTITPVLQAGGWWGKKEVLDPLTGKMVVAQLGSPRRLETIFRTNMQSSYAAAAWVEIEKQADVAPYLMYDAVDDLRTRPLHASWDQRVLPVVSAWWRTHYPPNGYNCRCGVIQMDAEQVADLGLGVSSGAPEDGTYTWTNPRTGVKSQVPNGLDPGFDSNPGIPYGQTVNKLLDEKVQAIGAADRPAAAAAIKQARSANEEIAGAGGGAGGELAQAAIERALLIAEEKSAQLVAQQQIDLIAAGKGTAGAGAAYKIKALKALISTDSWPGDSPIAQLGKVLALAGDYKLASETASKVAGYKKAILAGKIPPPAASKAFSSLAPAGQADVIKQIADAQAKSAAQKAALAAQPDAPSAVKAGPAEPNPATMTMIGPKTKGAAPGAIYLDTDTGTKWMVKFYPSVDGARNESLAAKLYNLAGVEAPELHATEIAGRPALASRIIDGIQEVDAKTLARTASVQEGFVVDAWLSNWDVAGRVYDNTVLIGGRSIRIDVGGALRYSGVGDQKGKAFGDIVGEIDSMRDASLNRQSAAVFGGVTQAQMEIGAVRVLRTRDDDIRALVDRYGPTNPRQARALADQLIERKADIARRFPRAAAVAMRADEIADAAPPSHPRVTATEQAFLEDSRINGYAFATDADQIEDNMVVAHAFRRTDGTEATRGWFKLLPNASQRLEKRIEAGAGSAASVSVLDAKNQVRGTINAINNLVGKKLPLDEKIVAQIDNMRDALALMQRDLTTAAAVAADPAELIKNRDMLLWWGDQVGTLYEDAKAGRLTALVPNTSPGVFPQMTDIPDSIGYTQPPLPGLPGGLAWKKVDEPLIFDTATFDRSFSVEGGDQSSINFVRRHYTAALPDGTVVTYVPHAEKNYSALQGLVKIDAPGKGSESTARIFSAMDAAGLPSARATALDRQHLYVNAFARLRLMDVEAKYRNAYAEVTDQSQDGLGKKLAILKDATGVDVEASEGWRSVDGVRSAFGHGRAYQLRPDLDVTEMAELDRTHVLYHNPQGLDNDGGAGVFERLKAVIEGGGFFASLTDRLRRGIPLKGQSVSSDLGGGGGDYHFTRILARSEKEGTGVYWRTSALNRMDAITYNTDRYGNTTDEHMRTHRLGRNVASFRQVSRANKNETIFKAGMSIFDRLDKIILKDSKEVNAAIEWMQGRGYAQWPDGRALTDVIVAKAQRAKRAK